MPTMSSGNDSKRTIRNEIKAARTAREKKAKFWRKFLKELRGRQYDGDGSPKRITNYPYVYMSTFLPELAGREPDVGVNARMQFSNAGTAEDLKLAIGTVLRTQKFLDELRLMVIDGQYAFMFAQTGMCEQGPSDMAAQGIDSGGYFGNEPFLDATMPFVERLSPFYAIWDDSAQDFKRCAYVGHEFTRDSDSVRNDERYDTVARARLGDGRTQASDDDRERFKSFEEELPEFHKLIQLYVAPTRTLYTLVETSANEFDILRKVPFYGPRTGPYHMRGFMPATDRVNPVAPAMGWFDAYVELELNEQKMNEQAQAERRVATSPLENADGAKRFKNAKSDDLVLGVGEVTEVHTGGVTQERLTYRALAKENVENLSAVASVRRENIGADSTATGASIVDQAANNRVSDMRRTVVELAKELCEDVKWFIHENASVKLLATKMSPEGLPADVMIQGGPSVDPMTGMPTPEQTHPDDFECDIDAKSLYMDNAVAARNKALQDATFITGPYSMWLAQQGMAVNAIAFNRWFAQAAQIPQLAGWVTPMSPMAMQMMQMANMAGGTSAQGVGQEITTKDPMQSAVQNSPATNDANSLATRESSLMRQAATAPGANNKETSFA